jgi:hypothetical protein
MPGYNSINMLNYAPHMYTGLFYAICVAPLAHLLLLCRNVKGSAQSVFLTTSACYITRAPLHNRGYMHPLRGAA